MYMDQVMMNQMVTRQTCRSNRKLDKYASAVVDYVTNNLGCSIYDIYLNAVNKEISLSTISRIAKANGISHKKSTIKQYVKTLLKLKMNENSLLKKKHMKLMKQYLLMILTGMHITYVVWPI